MSKKEMPKVENYVEYETILSSDYVKDIKAYAEQVTEENERNKESARTWGRRCSNTLTKLRKLTEERDRAVECLKAVHCNMGWDSVSHNEAAWHIANDFLQSLKEHEE